MAYTKQQLLTHRFYFATLYEYELRTIDIMDGYNFVFRSASIHIYRKFGIQAFKIRKTTYKQKNCVISKKTKEIYYNFQGFFTG